MKIQKYAVKQDVIHNGGFKEILYFYYGKVTPDLNINIYGISDVLFRTTYFFEINNSKNLSSGEMIYGTIEDNIFNILYRLPKNYCCEGMQHQFKYCSMHTINCPDYFVRYKSGFSILAENAIYGIMFCPFCGTKLDTLV